jgi:hypothetical protein
VFGGKKKVHSLMHKRRRLVYPKKGPILGFQRRKKPLKRKRKLGKFYVINQKGNII